MKGYEVTESIFLPEAIKQWLKSTYESSARVTSVVLRQSASCANLSLEDQEAIDKVIKAVNQAKKLDAEMLRLAVSDVVMNNCCLETVELGIKGNRHYQRVKRWTEFAKNSGKKWGENEEALNKALRALDEAKKSDDDMINLFLNWPDEPTAQPFTAIYGKRAVDHKTEAENYLKSISDVEKVLELFQPDALRKLLSDIRNDSNSSAALERYHALNRQETIHGLHTLRDLLKVANPKNKYISKQSNTDSANNKTYVILLAGLNIYLKEAKWSALEKIANANCPSCKVTADQIRKAWEHNYEQPPA